MIAALYVATGGVHFGLDGVARRARFVGLSQGAIARAKARV